MSSRLDKTIEIGLLAAIVFTAIAQGAVEAWSVAIFELIVLALLVLIAIRAVFNRELKIRIPSGAIPVAAILALGVIQGISVTGESGSRSALSMDIEATRTTVLVVFFLLLAYIIASNVFTERERLLSLVNFMVVYGLGMAVFALIQHFTWDGKLFWLRPTKAFSVFGPFVNRNHFAGYMEMLLPLPVALIVVGYGRSELRLFYAFAAAMMGTAAVTSLSRGGMIGMLAGLMFILLMSVRLPRADGRVEIPRGRLSVYLSQGFAVLAIAAAITAGMLWVGAAPVIDRVAESIDSAEDVSSINRSAIWQDTWSLFRSSPVWGAGMGAFQTAYPRYARSDGSQIVAQSHNDYLQVLADCGIAGGLIALSFIFLVFRDSGAGIKSHDPPVAGIAAGSGAGIFGILVHSLFDFNLQLPSNALLFLVLCAVVSSTCALAAERSSSRRRRRVHDVSAVGSV